LIGHHFTSLVECLRPLCIDLPTDIGWRPCDQDVPALTWSVARAPIPVPSSIIPPDHFSSGITAEGQERPEGEGEADF
jgi:hypothetical protein